MSDSELQGRGIGGARARLRERQRSRRRTIANRLDIDPSLVSVERTIDGGINTEVTEQGRQQVRQRRNKQLRQAAAEQSDQFGSDDFRIDRSGDDVAVEPTQDAINRERKERAAAEFEEQSEYIDNVPLESVSLTSDGAKLADSVVDKAESRATRQAAANVLAERIEGFGFAQPSDVTKQNGEFVLSQSARSDLQSAVDSGVVDKSEISNIDESVDPSVLGSVEAQIKSQLGDTPALNNEDVLQQAASQDEILRAVENQIENQSGTETRQGLIEDANLDVDSDGTVRAERVLLNSRRFDDFRDVGAIPDDVLGDANLSVDATEQFNEQIRESIAEQISERNVVDVTADDIDISNGTVDVTTPSSITIGSEDISDSGLTSDGQDNYARRQLQRVQTTEGVSVDTPVNSKPFANVSGFLAQAADGGGSLSSATRIVAASDTVDNIGDLDDLPDSRIIAGLDPEMAADRFGGIDEQQVRQAQNDIQQRRQQLDNNPQQVLESISENQDEFVNDSTRIGVAGERGQRIRQSARAQINELEADIAASDPGTDASDVSLTLTDELSGIRSVNEAGQEAIAQQVDDQLPNFDSSEIVVGTSDGQITTSIEDSVRDRFITNAERVQEIQARNRIADETEGIGRREIEVDDGTVGLSEEGVRQLRVDAVDGETGSGEIVPDLQTQTQGRDIDIRDVRLEQTTGGQLRLGISETARTRYQSPDLAADTTTIQQTNTTTTNQTGETELEATNRVATGINQAAGDLNDAIVGATGINIAAAIEDGTGRDLGLNTNRTVERTQGEQFGNFDWSFGLGDPREDEVEQALDRASAAISSGSATVGEELFDGGVSPVTATLNAAGRDRLASQYDTGIRNFGAGIVEGVGSLAAQAPQLATEAPEFAAYTVTNPGGTAEKLPGAVANRALLSAESAASEPANFGGQLVGSFALSGGVFRATQGTRIGSAARYSLQPGEELVKAGVSRGVLGQRAARVTPGVSTGQLDAETQRSLFDGEDRGQTDPALGLTSLSQRSTVETETDTTGGNTGSELNDALENFESANPEIDERQTSFRPEFDQEADIDAADPVQRRRDVRQREIDDRSRDRAFERSLERRQGAREIAEREPDIDYRDLNRLQQTTPETDLRATVRQQVSEPFGAGVTGITGSLAAAGTLTPSRDADQLQQTISETEVQTTTQQRVSEPFGAGVTGITESSAAVGTLTSESAADGEGSARGRIESGIESEAAAEISTGSTAGFETGAGVETGFETETETETEIGFESEAEREIETEIETGLDRESEREISIDSDTNSGDGGVLLTALGGGEQRYEFNTLDLI